MANEFNDMFYCGFQFEELDHQVYLNMCEKLPDDVYNSSIMSDLWFDYAATYCAISV